MFGNHIIVWTPKKREFRNVTEVHWNFNCSGQVAFESNIHHTGIVLECEEVENMIAIPETEIQSDFG